LQAVDPVKVAGDGDLFRDLFLIRYAK